MAQQKKFSTLQPQQRNQRQDTQSSNVSNQTSRLQAQNQDQRAGNFPTSNLSSSTSRLQASAQQPSYSSNISGINNRSQSSFPPQKRSSVPGFTNYSAIPPVPQILLAENDDFVITENDQFVTLDTPI